MKPLIILLIVLASIIVLLFILLVIIVYIESVNTYTHKGYNLKKNMEFPKGTVYEKYSVPINEFHKFHDSLDKEEIVITGYDGVKLVADYIPNTNKKKIIIFFHGYLSMPRNDFCSYMEYYKLGYSALLVNQRGHDRSGGKYITFGAKERFDCLYWAREAVRRFGDDCEIVLAGISLGGATVAMASNLDLPKQVKGIVSDCPFVNCKEIVENTIRLWRIPFVHLISFLMGIYCKLFGKFSNTSGDSIKAVKESKVPILLIHGKGDNFVPYECSVRIYNSSNHDLCEFYTTESNTHGASYLDYHDEYLTKVYEFFKKIGFMDK